MYWCAHWRFFTNRGPTNLAGCCLHSPDTPKPGLKRRASSKSIGYHIWQTKWLVNNMKTTRTAKIFTVVGARPNFMKAAPILAAIRDHNERLAKLLGPDGEQSSRIA